MSKELVVASNRHETKVAILEDDQLVEIYFQRQQEYSLAGSIHKGRVTRVLPGMQSAFVDIGLERDAFLYVSDFMEVEEGDDIEEVPTPRAFAPEPRMPVHTEPESQAQPRNEAQPFVIEGPEIEEDTSGESSNQPGTAAGETRDSGSGEQDRNGRGGWRGRRRRRGRRGERMPESRFSRPTTDSRESSRESGRGDRTEREEYGPPPGYQPIILPGESISKYQRSSSGRTRMPQAPSETVSSDNSTSSAPAPGIA